ncbi:hypothetical protein [Sphaerisporangium sp. TRM90804]|uniref:hypothetical protein n=1 Tax=Sphaerisporangium sp. TRM90804 TaxID=3031113 RepID=UPI00244C74DB|nr:hypothetical protein [Sphaerisporangium sp. TRM90804]MDH2429650.1 hypothetical protein [Sphaerisporangium sp. TRM90804]
MVNPRLSLRFADDVAICPGGRNEHVRIRGVGMADVIFVALTIAVFVIFGIVVKAVERL